MAPFDTGIAICATPRSSGRNFGQDYKGCARLRAAGNCVGRVSDSSAQMLLMTANGGRPVGEEVRDNVEKRTKMAGRRRQSTCVSVGSKREKAQIGI